MNATSPTLAHRLAATGTNLNCQCVAGCRSAHAHCPMTPIFHCSVTVLPVPTTNSTITRPRRSLTQASSPQRGSSNRHPLARRFHGAKAKNRRRRGADLGGLSTCMPEAPSLREHQEQAPPPIPAPNPARFAPPSFWCRRGGSEPGRGTSTRATPCLPPSNRAPPHPRPWRACAVPAWPAALRRTRRLGSSPRCRTTQSQRLISRRMRRRMPLPCRRSSWGTGPRTRSSCLPSPVSKV